jgi:hypothetical protein
MEAFMTWLKRFFCRHPSVVLERRPLEGTTLAVVSFVCYDCGYVAPAVPRTPQEHLEVVRSGSPLKLQAQPKLKKVRKTKLPPNVSRFKQAK